MGFAPGKELQSALELALCGSRESEEIVKVVQGWASLLHTVTT